MLSSDPAVPPRRVNVAACPRPPIDLTPPVATPVPTGPVAPSTVDSVIGFGAPTKAAGSHSARGEPPLSADDDTGRQPDLRVARNWAVPHPRPVKEHAVTDPSPLREGPTSCDLSDLLSTSSGGSATADQGDTAENHGQGSESAAKCEGGSDDADQ